MEQVKGVEFGIDDTQVVKLEMLIEVCGMMTNMLGATNNNNSSGKEILSCGHQEINDYSGNVESISKARKN
jgi:hypothetical protein